VDAYFCKQQQQAWELEATAIFSLVPFQPINEAIK